MQPQISFQEANLFWSQGACEVSWGKETYPTGQVGSVQQWHPQGTQGSGMPGELWLGSP